MKRYSSSSTLVLYKQNLAQYFAYRGMVMLLGVLILTGCSVCSWDIPEFRDLRRPQVLTEWHWDELIDYDCSAVIEEETGPLFDSIRPSLDEHYDTYVLSQADVLEVAVFGDDDTIVDNVVIAPDGNVYYTFAEAIPAAGISAEELGNSLEGVLSSLYIKPIVTVTPRTSFDRNYKILGRLQKPGVYPIRDTFTLLDAIAEAGGFLKETYRTKDKDNELVFLADLKNSFISRNGKKIPVDFDELVFKGHKEYNIPIEPGDYIYIAGTEAQSVFVLGAMRNPQRVRYNKGLRLTQALATVSGWSSGLVNQTSGFGGGIALGSSGSGTAFAPDLSRIIVIRGELDNPIVMTVDLNRVLDGKARDLILLPGDIVYASDKTMRFGRELVRLAIDTFTQAFGTTAGAYYGQNVWFPQT